MHLNTACLNSVNNSVDFNTLMATPHDPTMPSAPIRIILGGGGGAKNNSKHEHFYGINGINQQQHQPQIFSQPIPQPKTVTRLGDNLYEEATFNCNYDIDNSHTNYGYDMTLAASALTPHATKPLISTVTIPPVSSVIINQNRMMLISAKASSASEPSGHANQATSKSQNAQKQSTSANVKEICVKIDDLLSKNFMLVDPNSKQKPGYVKNSAATTTAANAKNTSSANVATLRKDNSQHLPQSIEKPMAKNFKNMNIGLPPNAVPDSDEETSQSQPIKIDLKSSVQVKPDNDMDNRINDSTSLSITDQSLRDEDAWLPILNIAEEQVSSLNSHLDL